MTVDKLFRPRLFPLGSWGFGVFLCLQGCALEAPSVPTSPSTEVPNPVPSTPSEPTSAPTPGVNPPAIQSPEPGSEVGAQPTLTVSNATTEDGTPPTYSFQVATDKAFADIVASKEDKRQGGPGWTSWKVRPALEKGKYFWRVLARISDSRRLSTSVADFTVTQSAEPPTPPDPGTPSGDTLVSDPLATGSSVGQVRGGRFIAQGWQVTSNRDFIRYAIPPLPSGYVEWDNVGLRVSNPNLNQFMLFGMWDPSKGDYRANPFRVHLQKLDPRHNGPYLRLRWISDGEQHDEGNPFLDWDPDRVYHWRIEWGPGDGGNIVRVLLNGNVMISQQYANPYRPDTHWVELGIQERSESIVGTIYSNLVIGRK